MHESIKAVCAFVFMVAAVVGSVAWFVDRPDQTTWLFRAISVVVAVVAIAVFLRVHWRRDLAPDFLYEQVGNYLERDGFCFNFAPTAVEGSCVFRFLFQNRYERECIARIALRPALFARKLDTLVYVVVRCPGGAFGIAERIVGLPAELQGKRIWFEIGADTEYAGGKGRMLRFRDATVLRRNTSFTSAFQQTTTVVALLGGSILLWRPARVRCHLPSNVAQNLPHRVPDPARILWQLGDPLPD